MGKWPPESMGLPRVGEDADIVIVGRDAGGRRVEMHTKASRLLSMTLRRSITGATVQRVDRVAVPVKIQT